jgi:hypothetical protein
MACVIIMRRMNFLLSLSCTHPCKGTLKVYAVVYINILMRQVTVFNFSVLSSVCEPYLAAHIVFSERLYNLLSVYLIEMSPGRKGTGERKLACPGQLTMCALVPVRISSCNEHEHPWS